MTPDETNARLERFRKSAEEDAARLKQMLSRKAEQRRSQKNDSETFGVAPATIPPFRDQLDCPPPSPDQWAAMIEHVSRYGCLPPGDGTGHVQTRDSWPEEEFVELTPEPPPPAWGRRVFLTCYYAVSLAGWVAIAAAVVHYAGGGR